MSGHGPKPGGLEVSSERHDGEFTVSLEGELDLASMTRIEEHLISIDVREPSKIVVDLSGLTFIDSSGLRVLLLADARARQHGYELVLLPGQESVQRVFEMTGAHDLLHFVS